jgi:hypothetical protein
MPSILNQLPKTKPRIRLTMIVKDDAGSDESHVLPRLLRSCEGVITSVATTLTQEREECGGCRAVLVQYGWPGAQTIPWVGDFAEARNRSLAWARLDSSPDWLLLLDADEELVVPDPGALFEALRRTKQNAVVIPLVMNGQLIPRVNLVRNLPGWRYEGGIVHADLIGNPNDPLAGPHVITKGDGARSRDPKKQEKDIVALREDWIVTGSKRSLYYLGITSKDAGLPAEAARWLTEFLTQPDTEPAMRYYAALSLGRIESSETSFLLAAHTLPSRPEAWCELAILAAQTGDWAMMRAYVLAALASPPASDLAYLEPHWLAWRGMDILSVALINLGWYDQAKAALTDLLRRKALPESERPRIEEHLSRISS